VTQPPQAGATDGVGSAAEQAQIADLLGSHAGNASSIGLSDLLDGPILRGMAVSP
jgi:hypothetical protein